MILANIILIIANIVNAYIDAYRIVKLDKRIRHGINFAAYLAIVVACIFIFNVQWVVFLISAFFNRQIFFDIPLNLKRGKKWYYVSLANPPEATMDKIEVYLFGYNGKAITKVYLVLLIVTIILQFIIT